MLKNTSTWIIIALLLLIIGMIVFWPSPEPDNTRVWKDVIAQKEARIVELRADSLKLARKAQEDSARRMKERVTYQNTIEKKDAEIARIKAKPEIIKVIEDNPVIVELLNEYEARDSVKTKRIATLEADVDQMRVDMNAMRDNFSDMMEVEREKYAAQGQIVVSLEKENRKHRREKRAILITGIAGVVAALLLGR